MTASEQAGLIAEDLADSAGQTLPDRACGSCTLCCKVFLIPELEKPAGALCLHAMSGAGCAIRPERPKSCREFFCGWRVDPNLGREWKPDRSGLVLWIARQYSALMITVDPDRPEAWRSPPYYPLLKQWGARALMEGKRVIVMVAGEATILLPDANQKLGRLEEGDMIAIERAGKSLRASVRRKL